MESKISLISKYYAWLGSAVFGPPKAIMWGGKMIKPSAIEVYGKPQERKEANPQAYSADALEKKSQKEDNFVKSAFRMHWMNHGGKIGTVFMLVVLCVITPLGNKGFEKVGQVINSIKQERAHQAAMEQEAKAMEQAQRDQMIRAVNSGQGPQLLKNMIANKNTIINNVKMGATNQQAAQAQLETLKQQYDQIKSLCNCEAAN